MVQIKEFEFPPLADQEPKVIPNVSNLSEITSEIVNFIDGAVSANFNNKFIALNEKFEKSINSRLERIEAKFDKLPSGNGSHASTSYAEGSKINALDGSSNWQLPMSSSCTPVNHI